MRRTKTRQRVRIPLGIPQGRTPTIISIGLQTHLKILSLALSPLILPARSAVSIGYLLFANIRICGLWRSPFIDLKRKHREKFSRT